jgi:hypothetical protein
LSCLSAEGSVKLTLNHVFCRRLSAAIDHSDRESVEGVSTAGIIRAVAVVTHNGS